MTTLFLAPGSLIVQIRRLLESRTLFGFSPSKLSLLSTLRTNNGTSQIDQKTYSFSNCAMVVLLSPVL